MTPPAAESDRTAVEWHTLFAGHHLSEGEQRFPFERALSFARVIEKWRDLASSDPRTYGAEWAELERDLRGAPALWGCVEDSALLERHADLIARLIRPLFPASDWSNHARVISGPFGGMTVARTANYDRVLGDFAPRALDVINEMDGYIRTLYAYKAILHRCFNTGFRLEQPLVVVVPNEATGVSRCFKFTGFSNFIEIEVRGALPELAPGDLDELLRALDDMAVWKRKLPPSLFRFVGVSVVSLTDVTDETASASIAQLVLTSEANVTEDNFDALEREVRNLFGNGTLRLGLTSLQADGELNVTSDRRIWNSLVIRDAVREKSLDWQSGVYGQALHAGSSVMVRDVADEVEGSSREHLLSRGVRSLFLQPLRYEERVVGLLELSSPEPRVMDASTALKVRRIEPVLALAVFQNLERFESRVEATVQNAYTAIHPSVQWRFRAAAIEMLEQEGESPDPVPIVFEDVYPLFGSADIRGSTRQRNEAVLHDAVGRLRSAHRALQEVRSVVPLTILDEMATRVLQRIDRCEKAWSTGDESDVTRFLADEVEPLLDTVAQGRESLRPVVDEYRRGGWGGDDSRAVAYESGRARVNRLITTALRREQAEQQRLYPHYFEHKETDGVEYTMFAGQSIEPGTPFDMAYVQNLRLRQLVVACEIGTGVHSLNQSLTHPLDITQLVVAQHAPVTLRFRSDEKRFDVDGPSGVRFEMLKKRLDKARVRGTEERITQPGTVTVVYSTEAEAEEYRRYAAYLVTSARVEAEPDVLDVEDLPGTRGLSALRMRIRL